MHTVAHTLAGSRNALRQKLFGIDGAADGSFAGIFGSSLGSPMSGRGRIEEALGKLGGRFPNLDVKAGEVGDGVAAAKTRFAGGEKDQVAVSPSLLAGMIGDSGLSRKIEDVISGFLDRGSEGNLLNFEGGYSVRAVSITVTTVRYSEFAKSPETGEVMAAADLKTSFHDKLADMIRRFFDGGKGNAGGEDATDGAAEGIAASDLAKLSPFRSLSASMWSVTYFYAASSVSGTAGAAAAGEKKSGEAAGAENGGEKKDDLLADIVDSWKYMAYLSGNIASSLSSYLMPNMLGADASGLASGGLGATGSGRSYFEQTMAGLGLEFGGFEQTREGHLFSMRERRNLLAELMELYEDKRRELGGVDKAAEEAGEAGAETADPVAVA